MPDPRFALCDISARYAAKLMEFGAPLQLANREDGSGGATDFTAYHDAANTCIAALEKEPADHRSDIYMLQRIRNHSDRLALILHGDDDAASNDLSRLKIAQGYRSGELQPLNLQREDFVLIRKFWELGTEEIVMQTVIELDGDVTTRIQPDFANDEAVALHDLHQASVNVSYQYWSTLIQLVVDFFATLFGSGGKGIGK